jgi:hypothetical protein
MQRKITRQSRGQDASEKRYANWVKNRGVCAACGNDFPLILHHCEGSAFKHNKIMLGHIFILGICQCCDNIITRGSRRAFRDAFGNQCDLWFKQLQEYPLKHEIGQHEIDAIMDWGK